ncbi:DUF72 domain-containing protein [Aneurinibacillus tyrosinisolvens]|uniref:DUF72 domain-containing protein n=1 Tax=Aneurinibacillus tyrosinisolvens TaxID=1443435 RepID=UPI00063FA612|nr:DUF72 domain-containing protein [Aneurinibacillus tyrosinisolvens]
MIKIGLTGWGDHDLYRLPNSAKNKLQTYSKYFSIVEVDSNFYAIPSAKTFSKWVSDTPNDFGFVVKAFQAMTGHDRGTNPYEDTKSMFERFIEAIKPAMDAGKLKAVLFQYPPWFDCTSKNVGILRYTKEKMKGIPCALEFRNQTWFSPAMRDNTLAFMQREGWIHSIVDEPQVGVGSAPTVLEPTHTDMTIVRLHGRNAAGWNKSKQANWREVRYLYKYNQNELKEWAVHLNDLLKKSKEVCVVFNNNSGGDALPNAIELMKILGIETKITAPVEVEQLNLFDLME